MNTDNEMTSFYSIDSLIDTDILSSDTRLEAWNITVRLYREWVARDRSPEFLPPYYKFLDRLEGTRLMFQDFDWMEKIGEGLV